MKTDPDSGEETTLGMNDQKVGGFRQKLQDHIEGAELMKARDESNSDFAEEIALDMKGQKIGGFRQKLQDHIQGAERLQEAELEGKKIPDNVEEGSGVVSDIDNNQGVASEEDTSVRAVRKAKSLETQGDILKPVSEVEEKDERDADEEEGEGKSRGRKVANKLQGQEEILNDNGAESGQLEPASKSGNVVDDQGIDDEENAATPKTKLKRKKGLDSDVEEVSEPNPLALEEQEETVKEIEAEIKKLFKKETVSDEDFEVDIEAVERITDTVIAKRRKGVKIVDEDTKAAIAAAATKLLRTKLPQGFILTTFKVLFLVGRVCMIAYCLLEDPSAAIHILQGMLDPEGDIVDAAKDLADEMMGIGLRAYKRKQARQKKEYDDAFQKTKALRNAVFAGEKVWKYPAPPLWATVATDEVDEYKAIIKKTKPTSADFERLIAIESKGRNGFFKDSVMDRWSPIAEYADEAQEREDLRESGEAEDRYFEVTGRRRTPQERSDFNGSKDKVARELQNEAAKLYMKKVAAEQKAEQEAAKNAAKKTG